MKSNIPETHQGSTVPQDQQQQETISIPRPEWKGVGIATREFIDSQSGEEDPTEKHLS